jgi:hypothetical protein
LQILFEFKQKLPLNATSKLLLAMYRYHSVQLACPFCVYEQIRQDAAHTSFAEQFKNWERPYW